MLLACAYVLIVLQLADAVKVATLRIFARQEHIKVMSH